MHGAHSTTTHPLRRATAGIPASRNAQDDHDGQQASHTNPSRLFPVPATDGVWSAQRDLQNIDEVVHQLREKLEQYRRRRAKQAGWTRRFVPTGLAPLDALLPHGGLPCGAITEMYADHPGLGSMTLAMRIVGRSDEATKRRSDEEKGSRNSALGGPSAGIERSRGEPPRHEGTKIRRGRCADQHEVVSDTKTKSASYHCSVSSAVHQRSSDRGVKGSRNQNKPPASPPRSLCRSVASSLPIVLIDTHGDFYPPAAEAFGISLDRLIVLRVRRAKDALWAAEQSLRSPAVGAVIAPLNDLDERDSRRLQLAAERSGCLGLILRPAHRRAKSFAAVQMLVESDEAIRLRRTGSATGGMAHAQRDHVGSAVRTTTEGLRDSASGGPSAGIEGSRKQAHCSQSSGTKNINRSRGLSEFTGWGCVPADLLNRENQHLSLRDSYRCRITLLAVREGMPTSPCQVDLYHETGTGDLPPLPVDRSMAKTG